MAGDRRCRVQDDPTAQIRGLTNGADYVCRAFAANAIGTSDASPISDAVRPCGSSIDCNPILAPVLGVLGIALAIGLILVFLGLVRSRRRGYVLAVVDVFYTANLGYGSRVGMGFIRDPDTKRVTEVVADKGKTAEIRIHRMSGGRFEIRDRHGRERGHGRRADRRDRWARGAARGRAPGVQHELGVTGGDAALRTASVALQPSGRRDAVDDPGRPGQQLLIQGHEGRPVPKGGRGVDRIRATQSGAAGDRR